MSLPLAEPLVRSATGSKTFLVAGAQAGLAVLVGGGDFARTGGGDIARLSSLLADTFVRSATGHNLASTVFINWPVTVL